MKPYILLKVGEKEYRLRISTSAAIELEDSLNTSIVEGLDRLSEIRVLAKYIYAATKQLGGIKSEAEALELIDEYTMSGGKTEKLNEIILDTMENSGYIKAEAVEMSKKMNAQMMEKIQELMAGSLSK